MDMIAIKKCSTIDNMCHNRVGNPLEFCYTYSCMFSDVFVWLPFDEFITAMPHTLNVAPSQLHLKCWLHFKPFDFYMICSVCISILKSFCITRPRTFVGWLSLVSQSSVCLFSPYTSLYKNFKGEFFKAIIKSSSWDHLGIHQNFSYIGLRIQFDIKGGRDLW